MCLMRFLVDMVLLYYIERPIVTTRINRTGPVVRGFLVNFLCEVKAGDLPISYSWTDPDGHILFPGDTDGNISVAVNTFGNYTCSATNAIGMDRTSVEMVQAGS